MPLFERATPPPLWSSFPASRLGHRRHQSTSSPKQETTDTKTNMGNTHSRSKSRDSSIFNFHRPSSKQSMWDPPPYESLDCKAPMSKVSSADSDSRYSFLKDFDTIFLVDDSSSMSGPRWREAEEAIAAIAPICTRYDGDGIDIYFLNHRRTSTAHTTGAYSNITTAAGVQQVFGSVRPRGSTPVGKRLLEILTPYLRRVVRMQAARNSDGVLRDPRLYVKPINIITITDGEFTDDAESVIVQVARALDSPRCEALPWQVGIQFFQIGDDEHVRRYLQELDDGLGIWCRDEQLKDIVDTVPWRGRRGDSLGADGILKCVLGAVNKKYDRRMV